MGTVSRNTGGDISTIIPDLIDTDHNQVTVSLNVRGQRGFAQAAYYGSFFRNHVPFMSWQNWATGPAGTGTVNTISSAPSNNYSQFSATGRIQLHADHEAGRQRFVRAQHAERPVHHQPHDAGRAGDVAERARGDARRSTRGSRQAGEEAEPAAAYKFDNRDNQTAIHIYQYADAEEAPAANANFPAGPEQPARRRRRAERQRQPALQQASEQVERRRRLRAGQGAVGQGRLRLPADRPRLPRLLDQLRGRGRDQRAHAARPNGARISVESANARIDYAY